MLDFSTLNFMNPLTLQLLQLSLELKHKMFSYWWYFQDSIAKVLIGFSLMNQLSRYLLIRQNIFRYKKLADNDQEEEESYFGATS